MSGHAACAMLGTKISGWSEHAGMAHQARASPTRPVFSAIALSAIVRGNLPSHCRTGKFEFFFLIFANPPPNGYNGSFSHWGRCFVKKCFFSKQSPTAKIARERVILKFSVTKPTSIPINTSQSSISI